MDKTYRTRDGREVRIYAIDGVDPFSVHGAIKEYGSWVTESWTKNGRVSTHPMDHDDDLIEVDEKKGIKTTISMDKQYRTKNGSEVRIYALDGSDPFFVHGAIKEDGFWSNTAWTADGHFSIYLTDQYGDLIETDALKEKKDE
jgi:hypothetical protein